MHGHYLNNDLSVTTMNSIFVLNFITVILIHNLDSASTASKIVDLKFDTKKGNLQQKHTGCSSTDCAQNKNVQELQIKKSIPEGINDNAASRNIIERTINVQKDVLHKKSQNSLSTYSSYIHNTKESVATLEYGSDESSDEISEKDYENIKSQKGRQKDRRKTKNKTKNKRKNKPSGSRKVTVSNKKGVNSRSYDRTKYLTKRKRLTTVATTVTKSWVTTTQPVISLTTLANLDYTKFVRDLKKTDINFEIDIKNNSKNGVKVFESTMKPNLLKEIIPNNPFDYVKTVSVPRTQATSGGKRRRTNQRGATPPLTNNRRSRPRGTTSKFKNTSPQPRLNSNTTEIDTRNKTFNNSGNGTDNSGLRDKNKDSERESGNNSNSETLNVSTNKKNPNDASLSSTNLNKNSTSNDSGNTEKVKSKSESEGAASNSSDPKISVKHEKHAENHNSTIKSTHEGDHNKVIPKPNSDGDGPKPKNEKIEATKPLDAVKDGQDKSSPKTDDVSITATKKINENTDVKTISKESMKPGESDDSKKNEVDTSSGKSSGSAPAAVTKKPADIIVEPTMKADKPKQNSADEAETGGASPAAKTLSAPTTKKSSEDATTVKAEADAVKPNIVKDKNSEDGDHPVVATSKPSDTAVTAKKPIDGVVTIKPAGGPPSIAATSKSEDDESDDPKVKSADVTTKHSNDNHIVVTTNKPAAGAMTKKTDDDESADIKPEKPALTTMAQNNVVTTVKPAAGATIVSVTKKPKDDEEDDSGDAKSTNGAASSGTTMKKQGDNADSTTMKPLAAASPNNATTKKPRSGDDDEEEPTTSKAGLVTTVKPAVEEKGSNSTAAASSKPADDKSSNSTKPTEVKSVDVVATGGDVKSSNITVKPDDKGPSTHAPAKPGDDKSHASSVAAKSGDSGKGPTATTASGDDEEDEDRR